MAGVEPLNTFLTNITEKAPQSSSTLRKQLLKDELDKLNYSLPDEYSSSWETNWGFHQHATSMIPRLHVKKKFEETWSEKERNELFPKWASKPHFLQRAIVVFTKAKNFF